MSPEWIVWCLFFVSSATLPQHKVRSLEPMSEKRALATQSWTLNKWTRRPNFTWRSPGTQSRRTNCANSPSRRIVANYESVHLKSKHFHQIAIPPPHQEQRLLQTISLTVSSQNCNFFIKIQGVVRSNFKFLLVFQPLLKFDFAEVKTVYIYKRKLVAQNHVLAVAKKWVKMQKQMLTASIWSAKISQFCDV